jgi:hypothetical protein
MRGLEPGDIIAADIDSEINFAVARIVSVARNAADWTADIVAERIELSLLVEGPSITSDGGGSTASITIDEGTTAVTTVTAANADATGAFSIVGGADAALFTIDADTGDFEFLSPPDYEAPADADANNQYEVTIQVAGNGLYDTQDITVTVEFVSGAAPATPLGLLLSITRQV